jgi:hypothetical protein
MPTVLRRADPSRPDADPRSRRGPIAATADPSSACQAMSAVGPVIDPDERHRDTYRRVVPHLSRRHPITRAIARGLLRSNFIFSTCGKLTLVHRSRRLVARLCLRRVPYVA